MNESNSENRFNGGRSNQDRQPQPFERTDEEILLGVGRFSCHALFPDGPTAGIITDRKIRKKRDGQHVERRSGRERRCGVDARSEVERFLQGERRSGLDRREFRYMSFRKARAFVRGLGLKSAGEWRDYVKSGMKPDDIPAAPHYIYANDGWAGWGDWLKAGVVSRYLSQYRYRRFKKFRALARGLGLISDSEWNRDDKAKKPHDAPADPQQAYASSGWVG